jgi:ribosomal protein S18 acetylase RimI-like enzyme
LPNSAPTDYSIVPAGRSDKAFLWQALYYAAHMDEEPRVKPESARTDPALAPYLTGWAEQADDLGFIAAVGRDRLPIGAAWLRRMPADWPLYRHVDNKIPELAIAVLPNNLSRGIGSALLAALIEAAKAFHPAVALSVRQNNPARRLYERFGFVPVATITNRVGGVSLVMKLELRQSGSV